MCVCVRERERESPNFEHSNMSLQHDSKSIMSEGVHGRVIIKSFIRRNFWNL